MTRRLSKLCWGVVWTHAGWRRFQVRGVLCVVGNISAFGHRDTKTGWWFVHAQGGAVLGAARRCRVAWARALQVQAPHHRALVVPKDWRSLPVVSVEFAVVLLRRQFLENTHGRFGKHDRTTRSRRGRSGQAARAAQKTT